MTKQASSRDYWSCLSRIDRLSRNVLREKENQTVIYGSELSYLIGVEIPRNPIRIMREASRIAQEAGIRGSENWSISNKGAQLCDDVDDVNFFAAFKNDVDANDADKIAALEILARVCEYVKSKA